MNKNDREFIGYVVAECSKKNVKVSFENEKFVWSDGTRCSGYFDEYGRELVVAIKKSQRDFLPIIVHEFSHFQQWVENDPVFINMSKNEELDGDMWEWMKGVNIPMSRVRKSIRAYQNLELDCEKRSVEHIKNFNLSINIQEYIKMANVYILFYSLLLKTKSWYVNPPYSCGKLLKIIPENFIKSFRLPNGFEKIALEECY